MRDAREGEREQDAADHVDDAVGAIAASGATMGTLRPERANQRRRAGALVTKLLVSGRMRVWLGGVLTLALAACAIGIPVPAEAGTTIRVDPSRVEGRISPLLFGANQRYGFNAYGSFDPTAQRTEPELVKKVKQAGVGWIRYPGGTTANLFHWSRAVGPVDRRGCQVDGGGRGNGGPLASDYGPDEHERFVEQIGGTSSIVVNFATGTPAEAAAWVQYMNGRIGTSEWADMRALNGHPEPYGVQWWEVGNEHENGTEAYWMGPGNGPGRHEANKRKYAFGGSTDFVRQPVGTLCDRRAAAAESSGGAEQAKWVDYPPVAPGQVVEVGGSAWREVDALAAAGPSEHVYTLDRVSGMIRFGDGTHGAIPPPRAPITITYTSGPHPGFVDFYRAMKAADPSINVCASYRGHAFLSVMGARPYDCFVSHPYLVFHPQRPREAHHFAMRGADGKAEHIRRLLRHARRQTGRDIQVAVSEFGLLSGASLAGRFHAADSDHLRSLSHALFTATGLVHFARLGIPLAGRHSLVDFDTVRPAPELRSPTGSSLFGFAPSFVPSASARVLELFTHTTGDSRVAATISGNPRRRAASGSYPALLVLASTDAGGRVSAIVVNRDPVRSIRARLVIGSEPDVLDVWTVAGPSTRAFNSPQHPHRVRLTETSTERKSWTFPAHSVTALRTRRSASATSRTMNRLLAPGVPVCRPAVSTTEVPLGSAPRHTRASSTGSSTLSATSIRPSWTPCAPPHGLSE